MFHGWTVLGLDENGQLEGIGLGYNKRSINLRNYCGSLGYIGVDLFLADMVMEVRAVNVYASCQHKPTFLDHFLSTKLLKKDFLTMGGDLNFSVGHSESWGH